MSATYEKGVTYYKSQNIDLSSFDSGEAIDGALTCMKEPEEKPTTPNER